MKKVIAAQLFLSANVTIALGATGERGDDYLVLLVPFLFITIVWIGYEVKAKLKARQKQQTEAASNADAQNMHPEETGT